MNLAVLGSQIGLLTSVNLSNKRESSSFDEVFERGIRTRKANTNTQTMIHLYSNAAAVALEPASFHPPPLARNERPARQLASIVGG